jgi:2-succinyl-5-enolpyruvyl-6-hydroxy-3-cyclohexene-1-carboxylate synthase
VHLNVPWREPLAPILAEGQVSTTDPIALEGRGDAPLHAVTPARPRAPESLLDTLAERIGSAARGLIVAGRQRDTGLAGPVAELAAAAGYPILAEPTSQLRRGPHDRSLLISAYDVIARDPSADLEPELLLRFGDLPTSKPLRQWLAAIDGLDQIVLDPAGEWREPTRRATTLVRAEPVATAHSISARLSRLRPGAATVAGSPFAARWLESERVVRETVDRRIAALEELSEPGVWHALGLALRDGDSVFAASSMPVRDLEAFLRPGPEGVRFAANRGANGIDGLVSTSAGLAEGEFEALLGTPAGLDPAHAARLFGLTVAVPATPRELDDALGGDARMVVVRTDRRRNLELHRELAEAAAASLISS